MKVRFQKMHGCGNDFVIVDGRKVEDRDWLKVAPKILNRRLGVGGDSLLVIKPSKVADAQMAVYEKDARESEMCGNGIRCVAQYIKDREKGRGNEISFETLAGIKTVNFQSQGQIRVDMGPPVFNPKEIPLRASEPVWGAPVRIAGRELKMFTLSMGNPHAVIFVNLPDEVRWVSELGPEVEHLELFPNRSNIGFVHVQDQENLSLRVWERGAGATAACGTGACAAGVVAIREGRVQSPVTIHFEFGEVEIAWREGEHVFMTGPATYAFEGEVEL